MSITHKEITTTVSRYLEHRPDEADHLNRLLHAMNTGADVTSRKEFNGGHVTCGTVVIDHDRKLLLIRHKTLDKWLLPRGHVEPGDGGLMLAALRELEEETGISWHGAVSPPGHDVSPSTSTYTPSPPTRQRANRPHWHADFRYAFWVKEPVVRLQLEEVDGYALAITLRRPHDKLANKIAHL